MAKSNLELITGRGLLFPFNVVNGRVQTDTGWELIRSNLVTFFCYEKGTRFFLGEFGMKLRAYLEDPNDDTLKSMLQYNFENDIPQWDARLVIKELEIERIKNDTAIQIQLEIGLSGTSLSETFIFPYYKEIIY